MSYRPSPKYASKSPGSGAWGTCDVCGFIWNLPSMTFQYEYRGGSTPVDTHVLKCPRCIDMINPQFRLLILPPDPPSLKNVRPENYAVDESNWLTTQDGSVISTQTGDLFVTSIPDPNQNANTAVLSASLSYHLGSVAVAYLDFFNGSPTATGVSVLSDITGSSVRTNVASSLSVNSSNVAVNTDVLTVTSSASNITNVGFVAIYSASSGGSLLTFGPVSATAPSIIKGAAVQFNALGLAINLA